MTSPASQLPDEIVARALRIAAALPPPTPEQLAKTRVLLAPGFTELAKQTHRPDAA